MQGEYHKRLALCDVENIAQHSHLRKRLTEADVLRLTSTSSNSHLCTLLNVGNKVNFVVKIKNYVLNQLEVS